MSPRVRPVYNKKHRAPVLDKQPRAAIIDQDHPTPAARAGLGMHNSDPDLRKLEIGSVAIASGMALAVLWAMHKALL
jgi:hypothetical protein